VARRVASYKGAPISRYSIYLSDSSRGSAFLVLCEGWRQPLSFRCPQRDLGSRAGAILFGEEHVVVLAAVEERVEINEVDGFVPDVLAQDFEVVAVIELVFLHCDKL
jgi:hypothetical protein